MARVKFSALVNSIQGSVGGSVFQRNKSGYTLKNKSVNVDKASIKQSAARNYMAELQNQWRGFTDVQRNAYDLFANYYPVKNRNNQNVYLSGYQLFLKYNLLRLHTGLGVLSSITYGNIVKLNTDVQFYWGNNELVASVDDSFDAAVFGCVFMASAPKSTGYPVKAKCYRLIQLTDIFLHYFYITQEYYAEYASVPGLGYYISYKVTFFDLNMPVVQEGSFGISDIISPP
jgi:hypothetical protein